MPVSRRVRKYFWDINPKKARPKSHPNYYIKRILELGDTGAMSWAKTVFGTQTVKGVAKHARLSPKSKNFWGTVL